MHIMYFASSLSNFTHMKRKPNARLLVVSTHMSAHTASSSSKQQQAATVNRAVCI